MNKEIIVSVIGLGYIGLPTAAVIAKAGLLVRGVDVNHEIVANINLGRIHIEEPGLGELVSQNVKEGRLLAETSVSQADVYIIAVPTPLKLNSSDLTPEPDISHIMDAITSLAPLLKRGNLVIIESTSPVGTTRKMMKIIRDLRPELKMDVDGVSDISICYCPERVIPGRVIHELTNNDRVVGGLTTGCANLARDFYKRFVQGECIMTSSLEQAEFIKLAENSFRDLNIAFANQISMICDKINVDVWEAITLANRHPRVNILQPGPGVGGHCIAVDPLFLVAADPAQSQLTKAARALNEQKPYWVVEKVLELAEKYPKKKIICCGLSFKPDVDDFRESPSLKKLFGTRVSAYDPNIQKLDKLILRSSLTEISDCDEILVMLVDHKELKKIAPVSTKIIDTRGCWSHQ